MKFGTMWVLIVYIAHANYSSGSFLRKANQTQIIYQYRCVLVAVDGSIEIQQ